MVSKRMQNIQPEIQKNAMAVDSQKRNLLKHLPIEKVLRFTSSVVKIVKIISAKFAQ